MLMLALDRRKSWFLLFAFRAEWGCFRECPSDCDSGDRRVWRGCDDVTEMITVARTDSHEDTVCVGNMAMGVVCKKIE